MKRLSLFTLLGFSEPYTFPEYLALLAAYTVMGVLAAATSLYSLYSAVVGAGPLPYLKASPMYYPVDRFPLAEIAAKTGEALRALRLEVSVAYSSGLVSATWSLLAVYSVVTVILLYPVVSKVVQRTPLLMYSTGLSPLRVYAYTASISYIYSLPASLSLPIAAVFTCYWADLSYSKVFSPGFVGLTAAFLATPLAFTSLYLYARRVDVPLLVLLIMSGVMHVSLNMYTCCGYAPLVAYAAIVFASITAIAKRRWAY